MTVSDDMTHVQNRSEGTHVVEFGAVANPGGRLRHPFRFRSQQSSIPLTAQSVQSEGDKGIYPIIQVTRFNQARWETIQEQEDITKDTDTSSRRTVHRRMEHRSMVRRRRDLRRRRCMGSRRVMGESFGTGIDDVLMAYSGYGAPPGPPPGPPVSYGGG
jgi:hypothetical protein